MEKEYNTPEYRADRRVVSFPRKEIKKKIKALCRKEGFKSVSSTAAYIFEEFFKGK